MKDVLDGKGGPVCGEGSGVGGISAGMQFLVFPVGLPFLLLRDYTPDFVDGRPAPPRPAPPARDRKPLGAVEGTAGLAAEAAEATACTTAVPGLDRAGDFRAMGQAHMFGSGM